MTLFHDTETTGMVLHREGPDHPGQPRIVQLGAILYDDNRRVVGEMNLLVKPEGWTIPAEATAVHGITTEQCERYGFPIKAVMRVFVGMVKRSRLRVAHNSCALKWVRN